VRQTPGNPDCPHCKGEGVILVKQDDTRPMRHPPAYRRCVCVLHLDILANVKRGMPGLATAPVVKESPLLGHEHYDLWITAKIDWFKAHLRHVAIRQPPTWYFKVVSDVDLMTAWLATAALKGVEIYDADAVSVSFSHMTLVDLVVPPQLLVVRTGVKAARNSATPEVLLETLTIRESLDLPTWVWDQPHYPLDKGNITWSEEVGHWLGHWEHISTDESGPIKPDKDGFTDMRMRTPKKGKRGTATLSAGGSKKTLRGRGKK
jgi:hypothetical protein